MQAITGSHLEVAAAFVYREARALDERRYEDWLEMWDSSSEVLYWVPAEDDRLGIDTISYIYDNRRRLQTRVAQLATGERYAQIPRSQTVRVVSNVEASLEKPKAAPASGGAVAEVLRDQPPALRTFAAFTLHEHRMDRSHIWAGRLEYELVDPDGTEEWRMSRKKVTLIDRASAVPSMAFLL